nr:unnamed protein product [Callosobruchus analis]
MRFVDSYQFLPAKLESLAALLESSQCREVRKAFPDDVQFNHMRQKGVFPYSYLTNVEKFNEVHLPAKECFYDELRDEHISDEEYSQISRQTTCPEIQEAYLHGFCDASEKAYKNNPADIISRGLPPSKLIDSDLWWHGSRRLREGPSRWPNTFPDLQASQTKQLEKRKGDSNSVGINYTGPVAIRELRRRARVNRAMSASMSSYATCKAANKDLKEVMPHHQKYCSRVTSRTLQPMNTSPKSSSSKITNVWGVMRICNEVLDMRRVTGNANLTYEEYLMFLTQTKAVFNSRPLIPSSDNPNDLTAHTSTHFLFGLSFQLVHEPNYEERSIHLLSR